MEEKKFLATKETIKEFTGKLKFKNVLMEGVDDMIGVIVNNLLGDKLAEKIPDDILPIVQEAIKTAVAEMPEIEI